MRAPDSEPAAAAGARLTPRRSEPADLSGDVTLMAAVVMFMVGAVDGALFLAATFAALLLLRRLELPATFELGFATGIVLQGWGNALLLFERIAWYDKAVHFLTPMLVVPSLYLLLARVGAVAFPWDDGMRRGTLGMVVVATALGIALATVWELVEGSFDRWLGTSFAHGYLETLDDLYSSLLGSLAAGGLLVWLVTAGGRDLSASAAPQTPRRGATTVDRGLPPARRADVHDRSRRG